MPFVLKSSVVIVGFFGLIPATALIFNFKQAIAVPWWQMPLGPIAWFFTSFAGKSGNNANCLSVAVLCVLAVVIGSIHDTFSGRFISTIGLISWFLFGLAAALAWT